ncbi:MAG: hypothetical protein DRH56_02130 [Deltaproteobacteria bacterium]|nr:MAG: hypothetical protein DRH56_02130 [Deltaproteobacteria bacterium]
MKVSRSFFPCVWKPVIVPPRGRAHGEGFPTHNECSENGPRPGAGPFRMNLMKVNCQDHRKSMELLGLRRRLKEGIRDPRERDQVEKRIRTLEKELGMD